MNKRLDEQGRRYYWKGDDEFVIHYYGIYDRCWYC